MATERIYPTEGDVGGGGKGNVATEANVTTVTKSLLNRSAVISGLTPSVSSGLVLSIASGEAFISGFYVNEDAARTVTLAASSTRAVYMQLTKDSGGKVTGIQLVDQAEATAAPADSVLLARATTSASAITTLIDAREGAGSSTGIYTGDGTASKAIALGRPPLMVFVASDAPRTWACSGPAVGFFRTATQFGAGFFSRVDDDATVNRTFAERLGFGSLSTNLGTIAAGSDKIVDVTVTGASDGVMYHAAVSGLGGQPAGANFVLSAYYQAANTVRVVISNVGTVSSSALGTQSVFVWQMTASNATLLNAGIGTVTSATGGSHTPKITATGFTVGKVGANSLNESGLKYAYFAIF